MDEKLIEDAKNAIKKLEKEILEKEEKLYELISQYQKISQIELYDEE